MKEAEQMSMMLRQAEIIKAALSEMLCHIPQEAESAHRRATLAADALLAIGQADTAPGFAHKGTGATEEKPKITVV